MEPLFPNESDIELWCYQIGVTVVRDTGESVRLGDFLADVVCPICSKRIGRVRRTSIGNVLVTLNPGGPLLQDPAMQLLKKHGLHVSPSVMRIDAWALERGADPSAELRCRKHGDMEITSAEVQAGLRRHWSKRRAFIPATVAAAASQPE